jgi:hypothetical protein
MLAISVYFMNNNVPPNQVHKRSVSLQKGVESAQMNRANKFASNNVISVICWHAQRALSPVYCTEMSTLKQLGARVRCAANSALGAVAINYSRIRGELHFGQISWEKAL